MYGYKVYAYILYVIHTFLWVDYLQDCKGFHDFTAPFKYKPLEIKFSKDCGIHSSASLPPWYLYKKGWKCFNHILVGIKDPPISELAERSYDDFSLANL